MNRVEGSAGVRLLECTNPVKDKWRIRWDVQVRDDGSASYMEEEFTHKPSAEEIRAVIVTWINSETDRKILSGFVWNDMPVWLSSENQFNYKAAYDLAAQTGGATLPVRFKFGIGDVPTYHTFNDLAELTDFYTKALAHVNTTLNNGWEAKDNIDWSKYE